MTSEPTKKPRLRDHGLTVVLLTLFLSALLGQIATGRRVYNAEQREHGEEPLSVFRYVASTHFLSATMENWESEFLQMFAFVLMTVYLFQRGSSESKNPDEDEEVDRDPRGIPVRPDMPFPVRRGGIALRLYENSLSLAFLALFLMSFALHAFASVREYNLWARDHGEAATSIGEHLSDPHFWFESFQNWQSEFLAIASMVVLSIFLRQRGSPESKPVDAPHSRTGG